MKIKCEFCDKDLHNTVMVWIVNKQFYCSDCEFVLFSNLIEENKQLKIEIQKLKLEILCGDCSGEDCKDVTDQWNYYQQNCKKEN